MANTPLVWLTGAWATAQRMERAMSIDKIEDPHALFLELMRQDFAVFARKAAAWIRGGDLFEWNWHLDAIVHQLDRVHHGECRRLLVNLPPRNGKSVLISIAWVAWLLGRNPKLRIVCVSYSNDLSAPMARECLAIIQSPWYREVFPGTILKRTAAHDIETTRGGGRLSTSITGTLTGRGGDIIILDDVIKPQEADSEIIRANVNAWYQSTLTSRLNDKRKGAIICVMQRLHEYDLAGLMIETGSYDILSLPAIATSAEIIPLPRGHFYKRSIGEVLHPEREPLETLEEMRIQMGSERFAGQYLQSPVPAVGNIIKAAWIKSYAPDELPQSGCTIVQSIDTANKAGANCDFSVVVTALVAAKFVYVLDVYRRRLEFPDLRREVIRLAREFRPHTLLIEEQGSGIGLISELAVTDVREVPPPIGIKATIDKQSRVHGISAMIENGQVLLPQKAPWLGEFKAELLAFPNGRFDDQVDAFTQLLIWARERFGYDLPINAGPEIFFGDDDDGGGVWIGGDHEDAGATDDIHDDGWG